MMSEDNSYEKKSEAETKIITIIFILLIGLGWGLAIASGLELDGYHILVPIGMCIGGQLTIMKIVDNPDMTFNIASIVLIGSIIFGMGYGIGYDHGKLNIESHEGDNETSSRPQQPNRGHF